MAIQDGNSRGSRPSGRGRRPNFLNSGILKPLSTAKLNPPARSDQDGSSGSSSHASSTNPSSSQTNPADEGDAPAQERGLIKVEILSAVGLAKGAEAKGEPWLLISYGDAFSHSPPPKYYLNNDASVPVWNHSTLYDWAPSGTILLYLYSDAERTNLLGSTQVKLPQRMADGRMERHWLHFRGPAGETLTSSIYVNVTFQKAKTTVALTPQDFDVIKVLGCGSYGTVYKVRKKDNGRCYAMKVLSKSAIAESRTHSHVLSERKVLQYTRTQAASPFLVGLKFSFQTDSHLYFVMDLKSGGELFDYLQREGGRFDEPRVRFYVGEILLAIETLHANNIIYRDLKPENILLDDAGHVALCDFGLAKSLDKGLRTKTFCGTSEYLPPEVIDSDIMGGYDGRADFWALGILMFEMLTGYTPFYAEDKYDKFEKIRTAELKIPKRGISDDARDLLTKLLTREAGQRLGTSGASEVKQHPFFASVDWDALADRRITPPVKPDISIVDDESPNGTPGLADGPFASSPLAGSRRSSCASDSSASSIDDDIDWWRDFSFSHQSNAGSRASSFSSFRGKPKLRGLSMSRIDIKSGEAQVSD